MDNDHSESDLISNNINNKSDISSHSIKKRYPCSKDTQCLIFDNNMPFKTIQYKYPQTLNTDDVISKIPSKQKKKPKKSKLKRRSSTKSTLISKNIKKDDYFFDEWRADKSHESINRPYYRNIHLLHTIINAHNLLFIHSLQFKDRETRGILRYNVDTTNVIPNIFLYGNMSATSISSSGSTSTCYTSCDSFDDIKVDGIPTLEMQSPVMSTYGMHYTYIYIIIIIVCVCIEIFTPMAKSHETCAISPYKIIDHHDLLSPKNMQRTPSVIVRMESTLTITKNKFQFGVSFTAKKGLFDNMKEEVLENEFGPITKQQWNNTLHKSNKFRKSFLTRKHGLSLREILAIKLYTDFDHLQSNVKHNIVYYYVCIMFVFSFEWHFVNLMIQ